MTTQSSYDQSAETPAPSVTDRVSWAIARFGQVKGVMLPSALTPQQDQKLRKRCAMPSEQAILGCYDMTVFGDCSIFLAFAERGIFYATGSLLQRDVGTPARGFINYSDLQECRFQTAFTKKLLLSNVELNASGVVFPKELDRLLWTVQLVTAQPHPVCRQCGSYALEVLSPDTKASKSSRVGSVVAGAILGTLVGQTVQGAFAGGMMHKKTVDGEIRHELCCCQCQTKYTFDMAGRTLSEIVAAPSVESLSATPWNTALQDIFNMPDVKAWLAVAPHVPEKKEQTARAACQIPQNEAVFALCDFTVFGSAKNALVFGEKAIYWNNQYANNPEILTYGDLRHAVFTDAGLLTGVKLGDGRAIGSANNRDEIVELLHRLQAAAQHHESIH